MGRVQEVWLISVEVDDLIGPGGRRAALNWILFCLHEQKDFNYTEVPFGTTGNSDIDSKIITTAGPKTQRTAALPVNILGGLNVCRATENLQAVGESYSGFFGCLFVYHKVKLPEGLSV